MYRGGPSLIHRRHPRDVFLRPPLMNIASYQTTRSQGSKTAPPNLPSAWKRTQRGHEAMLPCCHVAVALAAPRARGSPVQSSHQEALGRRRRDLAGGRPSRTRPGTGCSTTAQLEPGGWSIVHSPV
ncbi:unnamed protein product [Diplocarpon coronariae]